MILSDEELLNLMYRCDRAIGKLREERLSRANATRQQVAALVDEAIDASIGL